MTDSRLRELERRWKQTGTAEAEAAVLAERVRSGLESPSALRLSAYLGRAAAALALGGRPEPEPVTPPWRLRKLFGRFHAVGGVVEHLLFDPAGLDGAAGHELVARETVRTVSEDEAAARQPDATSGTLLELKDFLGRRFALPAERMLFPAPGGDLLPATEAAAARAAAGGWGSSDFAGYAYAFADPPYGLSAGGLEATERLFAQIWERLVGTFDPAQVEVYSWATESWSWFEAGREWWGSFLWTVRPPGDRPWIGIAASATD